MKHLYLLTLIFTVQFLKAQENATYFIGHSLIGHDIPHMVKALRDSQGANTYSWGSQIINGSNLLNNWSNPQNGENGGNYQIDLSTNSYRNLIVTEAIPLKNHVTWSDTYGYADNFYNHFYQYSNAETMYIYETWHCLDSGTTGCDFDPESNIDWRVRLDEDLDDWEAIANQLNSIHPETEVLLVPGGQAMARLYDEIIDGNLTGVSNIQDLFNDNIHLNDIGSYYMACVMYATIFKESPEGLTLNINDVWGQPYNAPSSELGLQLQQIAWEVSCLYDRNGVDCGVLSNQEFDNSNTRVILEDGLLKITTPESLKRIAIYDLSGKLVIDKKLQSATHKTSLNIKHLKGLYVTIVTFKNGKKDSIKILIK